MRYSFREIHTLNILSDNPLYSQYFKTPNDLKVMVWIILLCFLVATVGAFLFTVDKIVPARGIIDTKSELFDVRNTEPGFIEKMFVREGDLVNMGQVLIQFDTEFIDLEINSLQQQKDNLSRNIWSDFFQIKKLIDTQTKTTLSLSLEKIPNPINQLGYGEYLSKPFLDTKAVNDERQRNLVEQVLSGQRQQDNIRARIVLQQKERQRIKRLYIDGIESLSSLDQVEANELSLQAQYESNLDKIGRASCRERVFSSV